MFGFLGGGGLEVVEDFAPGGIGGGGATVAFVDDDEVEECWGEFAEEFLAFLGAGDGLIETEVDFVGGVDAAVFVEGGGEGYSAPSSRSMVLALVESLAILPAKGRKSLTMVWSMRMLRSARKRMRFLRPAFQRRQMIWKAV